MKPVFFLLACVGGTGKFWTNHLFGGKQLVKSPKDGPVSICASHAEKKGFGARGVLSGRLESTLGMTFINPGENIWRAKMRKYATLLLTQINYAIFRVRAVQDVI